MTEDELRLRALVRDVLDSTTLSDPGQIAVEVDKRIPNKLVRVMLRQALRGFVRQVISEQRLHTRITQPGQAASTGRSSRVASIRDHWQKALRDSVHVGGSEWKRLGECNRADLLVAAAERRQQASRNRSKAAQYEILASLVGEYDVPTVADLPAEILIQSLGVAA